MKRLSDRASEIVVYCIGGPPGIGKTTNEMLKVLKLLQGKVKVKVLITSGTHSWCYEWGKFLADAGVEVRHWEGWKRKCPLWSNDEEKCHPLIWRLRWFNLPTKNICTMCQTKELYSQKDCPYKQQFENLSNVVIAPIQYVFTKYLDKFGPDIIFIDDCLKAYAPLHSREEIAEFINKIQTMSNMKANKKATFEEILLMEEDEFETYIQRFKDEYQLTMRAAALLIDADEQLKLLPVLTFQPEEIEEYYRCRKFLGNLKVIGVPAIFPLFDYLAVVRPSAALKIIDARFKPELLELWKKRYWKETRTAVNFVPENFRREFEDCDSVVYQIKAHTWFPPGSLEKTPKLKRRVKDHIAWVLETQHPNMIAKNIGMIHPLKFKKEEFIPDRLWDARDEVGEMHYGDLRGKNDLKDRIVGFVICTYVTEHYNKKTGEGIITDFKMMFAVDPSTEYVNDDPHGGHYRFKDKYLDAWRWLHEEYEQYQAIHRFRPLNHKTIIYVYGLVPDEIREDDLIVQSLSFKIGGDVMDEKTKWLFEYVKAHDNCVPEKTARTDMGKEFKVGEAWAYQIIRLIVRKNDELEFNNRNGLKCIIHK